MAVKLEVLIDVAAAIGQVASALFAIPAAAIAYFAYKTSKSSAKAAEKLTQIERSRWYAEFYPQFEGRLFNLNKKAAKPAYTLQLSLAGPALLHELDRISVYIRADSRYDKEAGEFVEDCWTFKFANVPYVEDPQRTTAIIHGLRRGESKYFALEPMRDLRPPAGAPVSVAPSVSLYVTERESLGARWPNLGYVFTTPIGTPIDPRNCTRLVQTERRRAGLPPIRLHDLRHGCVSVLLDLGTPPRTVMEIVGHSTMEMTMTVYGHVSLDAMRSALDQFGGLLDDESHEDERG